MGRKWITHGYVVMHRFDHLKYIHWFSHWVVRSFHNRKMKIKKRKEVRSLVTITF